MFKQTAIGLFHVVFLSLAVSCSQAEDEPDISAYSADGVSLTYPSHWKHSYDDTPALYAERAIGFGVSEFSTATVLIDDNQAKTLSSLADRFEKELNLLDSENVADYQRREINIDPFQAQRLSWVDTFSGLAQFELTVVQISEKPAAFIVLNLSDEDIDENTKYIEGFSKSVKIKS